MSLGDWMLIGLAALACVPVAVIAIEVFAAAWPGRRLLDIVHPPRSPCAILIPAHNEEAGIGRTIATLRSQLRDGDRIVVVADNCSDGTVLAARAAGAEAIERHDPHRRGKGYALDFGVRYLSAAPPTFVVLIDADTRVLPGALDALVGAAAARDAPVQGVFTDAPKSAGAREQWSAFALTFKNLVRPLGLHRLGLPCLLSGSGMAFPWAILSRAELGTGNIVEDMQLGIDLAVAGAPPGFCPDARFQSDDAPSIDAAAQRRTRWEHGHVFTLLAQVPRLFWAGLRQRRLGLWALALELSVPPLSLLFVLHALLAAVCAAWVLAGGSSIPALILLGGAAAGLAALLTAWFRYGRKLLSPRILCLLPVYVLWKVPIYLKLLVAPQRNWVRTERTTTP